MRGRWTHGLSRTPGGGHTRLFRAWLDMHGRCTNPKLRSFKSHGARGIAVCERWRDFVAFAEDMGAHPGKGWTLERKDNDGNYEPANCVWATQTQQCRNMRTTRLTEETAAEIRRLYVCPEHSQRTLATQFAVSRSTIQRVVEGRGWL